jgi:transmembrane sensor
MNVHSIERAEPRTAAEWFAVRKGSRDEEVERRFSAWLASNAENFEAYAMCELTWELAASAAAGLSGLRVTTPWYRRRPVGAVAAALVLASVALGFVRFLPPRVAVWSTKPGEQRSLTLEDGSHVTLNTRSVVEVRMGRKARDVRIVQGEAFFDIAHDESRPFNVDTSLGTVRAVGTRFDVLLDEQRVEVSMEEGKVFIKSAAPGGQEVAAVAGMRVTLLAGSSRPALDSADLTGIENWRAHRIEFDRVPLAMALREFSRYTALPIRVESPQIGQMSVSAVLQAGDVKALRAPLNGAFGLRLVERQNELVVVEEAP